MIVARRMTVPSVLLALAVVASPMTTRAMGKDYAPKKPASVKHIPNANPRPEPFSQYGNPESYVIDGKRYAVKKHNKNHVEHGIASWYGMKFHGKRTSSGELYDIYGMTAAHKTLPIPTYAEVKNLDNGKTVVVKVNDRGPFVDNRIIDLSFAAAKKLDIVKNGTGRVMVRAISFDDDHEFTHGEHHFLQLGAFKSFENAWQLRQKVKHLGANLAHIQVSNTNTDKLYHVKLGPVKSHSQQSTLIQELNRIGIMGVSHVLGSS